MTEQKHELEFAVTVDAPINRVDEGEQSAIQYLADRFAEAGYEPIGEVDVTSTNSLHSGPGLIAITVKQTARLSHLQYLKFDLAAARRANFRLRQELADRVSTAETGEGTYLAAAKSAVDLSNMIEREEMLRSEVQALEPSPSVLDGLTTVDPEVIAPFAEADC